MNKKSQPRKTKAIEEDRIDGSETVPRAMGNGCGETRYSGLKQIDAANVDRLGLTPALLHLRGFRVFCCLLLAFLFLPNLAWTQMATSAPSSGEDKAPPDNSDIPHIFESITVTTTLNPATIGETPGTVSVIDADTIQGRLIKNISDLVKFEPGVILPPLAMSLRVVTSQVRASQSRGRSAFLVCPSIVVSPILTCMTVAETSPRENEVLRTALTILKERLAPGRIILFGSRAEGRHTQTSDFDFAVDVARPTAGRSSQIRDEINDAIGLYKADIVYLPDVDPDFRRLILSTGKVVYERQD